METTCNSMPELHLNRSHFGNSENVSNLVKYYLSFSTSPLNLFHLTLLFLH